MLDMEVLQEPPPYLNNSKVIFIAGGCLLQMQLILDPVCFDLCFAA